MELRYTAKDKTGRRIKGIAHAEAISALVGRLKNQGFVPLSVKEIRSSGFSFIRKIKFVGNRVSGKELSVFTRQLASTLSAGLLLTESLGTIADDLDNLYFSSVIKQAMNDIKAGLSFSGALSKFPNIFSPAYIAMVKSGEKSGSLDRTLAEMAKFLEYFERIKNKINTALRYPIFIVLFFIFVVSVIVLFIIPKFAAMFTQAKAQLPLLTRIVVSISEFFLGHAIIIIISSLVLIILFWYALRFKKFRYHFDSFKLRIPFLGKILQKSLISRLYRTLSILLFGGVGIATSLSIASEVTNNLFLQKIMKDVRNGVVAGFSIAELLRLHDIFPRLSVKMAEVGERTGKLNEMLERTSQYYDDEVDIALSNFVSSLEPALIIIIGMVVLIVVIALYLPIFELSMAVR